MVKPRYIYSSQIDLHHKRVPFRLPNTIPCRFISLGSIPGQHKPADSKQVYIQAIEIEPISKAPSIEELKALSDTECHPESPFQKLIKDKPDVASRIQAMAQYRFEFGQKIIALEDAEIAKKQREESKRGLRKQPIDDESQYKKEECIVYVSGFDRHLAFVDLENYLKKYGEIVQIESKIDNVRESYNICRKEETKDSFSLSIKKLRVPRML
jgi:hypothetical protein